MYPFDKNVKPNKSWHNPFSQNDPARVSNRKMPSPDQIRKLVENPELRFSDHAEYMDLVQMLMANPGDADLQEMFLQIIDQMSMDGMASGDPFYGSYPARGQINYPPDFISLGHMPTGDEAGVILSQLPRNVLVAGPAGSGKTSCIKVLLANPKLFRTIRVVMFVKKRELRGLLSLLNGMGFIVVFQLEELKLAFSQPPAGVKDIIWSHELTRITGQCYSRYSAHRLMAEKLDYLMTNRPAGMYPTLSQLIQYISDYRPAFHLRDADYKESILGCLTDLQRCCGSIFEHGSSDFLEVLFSSPGLAVIEVETLPQEHLAWLAVYFMRWIYCKRLYQGH